MKDESGILAFVTPGLIVYPGLHCIRSITPVIFLFLMSHCAYLAYAAFLKLYFVVSNACADFNDFTNPYINLAFSGFNLPKRRQ